MNRAAAIKAEGLQKQFSREKLVFTDLSLDVPAGARLAISGANGVGKTTLLRILSTLLAPTAGDAWIDGVSLTRNARQLRGTIGWMPARDDSFYPRLTGEENLRFFAALLQMQSQELNRRLDHWREIPVFSEALRTPFYLCSTGMKHLLTLSRAVLHEPSLVLLDEPTRSFDKKVAGQSRDLLLKLVESRTLIFATHSTDDTMDLADMHLELSDGRLI